jgi:cytochrome c-type biogenesis protein CcsB
MIHHRILKALGFTLILALASSGAVSAVRADEPAATPSQASAPAEPVSPRNWNFKQAGLIPVQSGGRLKPLDSFAREMVLYETGSRSFEGWDPIDMIFSWITHPTSWDQKAFVQVAREDVKRELGLDEKLTRFSPHELYQNNALHQYAEHLSKPAPGQPEMKQSPREQELRRVLDRLGLFRSVVTGEAWLVIPKPVPAPWGPLTAEDKESEPIRNAYIDLIKSYQTDDGEKFEVASSEAKNVVEARIPEWSETVEKKISAESFNNRMRPFRAAWILYLFSALIWAFLIASSNAGVLAGTGTLSEKLKGSFSGRLAVRSALAITLLAFLVHVAGIGIRCFIAGRPPVTNMYESIMWVSLGVVVFSGVLYAIHRQPITLAISSALATFGLIAGDAAPSMMDPGIHPLVPVLRSNYWLTIHVLTITLGYAAFALTLGIANVTIYQYLRRALGRESVGGGSFSGKINGLNQLTYRAMQFGVVLLAAGTILGGVWADYSWGRFWGWDPKEVWALIALLSYLVILHGRFSGWVGQFSYAAWTVVAFLSVVMAWYGVNFILGVGLHSYGFSSGGLGYVCGFVGSQLLFVGITAVLVKTKKKTPELLPKAS